MIGQNPQSADIVYFTERQNEVLQLFLHGELLQDVAES